MELLTMTRRTMLAFCAALGVMTIAAVPPVSAEAAGANQFAIVVTKDFPLDGISFGDLKRLYLGEQVNTGGQGLKPLSLNKSRPERTEFDKAVLGMDAETVGLYWTDRKIRGQSGPPKALESPELLLRVVAQVAGTVGYVRANAVKGPVKVLRIDGKKPDQPGYRVTR